MDTQFSQNYSCPKDKIFIVGVGGAGVNAIDRLSSKNLPDVNLIAINTDLKSLEASKAPEKILIGGKITKGLSSGGNPTLGKKAALEDFNMIRNSLNGACLVFIITGLGSGTGSGASPVVADIARGQGAIVISFATTPFIAEGKAKEQIVKDSIENLSVNSHCLIKLNNEILLNSKLSIIDAFTLADTWILTAIESITNIIKQTGLINVDFASFKRIFNKTNSTSIFSIANANINDSSSQIISNLENCPLNNFPKGKYNADKILISIKASSNINIQTINSLLEDVSSKFEESSEIIIGAFVDDAMNEQVQICVIGTYQKASNIRKNTNLIKTSNLPLSPNESLLGIKSVSIKKKNKISKSSQSEFDFANFEKDRGFFENTPTNMYSDTDLDIPTFRRKGMKIKL